MITLQEISFSLKSKYNRILVWLVGIDFFFIFLHILYRLKILSDLKYSIEFDGGHAEIFQYMKSIFLAVLLLLIFLKNRYIMYLAWSLFFLYVFLDDWMTIHERLGNMISNNLYFDNLANLLSLRPQDIGSLLVFGLFGIFFLILFGISYFFANENHRKIFRSLLSIMFFLIFFGVFVDLIHSMTLDLTGFIGRALNATLGLVEDGGEMFILSFFVWFVYRYYKIAFKSKKNQPIL